MEKLEYNMSIEPTLSEPTQKPDNENQEPVKKKKGFMSMLNYLG